MRVFVTGASGWIGSAVVPELLAHGHSVVGLARSDASAAALEQAGAEVVRGGIDDLDVLRDAAAASDGVIHLAFKHDIAFSGDYAGAATADSAAIETLGSALEGTGKPFFIASGVLGLTAPGQVATETDGHDIDPSAVGPAARALNAELALSFAERGVRSGTVRLAPTVHGEGDEGFMASIVGVAKEKGVSAYVGDGSNRWPAVHRSDAARLYRLALEQAPAGSTLHAVAEEGVSFPRHRRSHRSPARRARHLHRPGRRGCSLRLARRFHRPGLSSRRARLPASCWVGSRPGPASSRTSTPATTPGRSRLTGLRRADVRAPWRGRGVSVSPRRPTSRWRSGEPGPRGPVPGSVRRAGRAASHARAVRR